MDVTSETEREFAPEPRERTWAQRLTGSTAFWITLLVVIMAILFGLLSPRQAFLRVDNLLTIGLNASVAMLLAVGMSFILGAREIDLSIGSNLVLSSVLAARTITTLGGTQQQIVANEYPNLALAVLAGVGVAILAGTLFGLANGLLVTRLRVSSFIVTLGTTGIGMGAALVITGGNNIPYLPRAMQMQFGVNRLFGVIPLPLLLVLLIALVLGYVMHATRFGLYTLAIGSSREAAERAGVGVDRHRVLLFMLMGLLCGIAALIDISRFGTTSIGGNATVNLKAISAAVIGGTSLFGGVASIFGAIVGSLIPAILENGLVILRTDAFYQLILVGALLIAAVYVDQRRHRDGE